LLYLTAAIVLPILFLGGAAVMIYGAVFKNVNAWAMLTAGGVSVGSLPIALVWNPFTKFRWALDAYERLRLKQSIFLLKFQKCKQDHSGEDFASRDARLVCISEKTEEYLQSLDVPKPSPAAPATHGTATPPPAAPASDSSV
jgi:hypothetical protein